MPDPVRYRSTNNRSEPHTLGQALLTGQAPDRGLFMPQPLPRLTSDDLRAMQGMSYPDVAHAILSRYVGDEFSSEELHQICADAYDFEVPLEKVHGRRYLLRRVLFPVDPPPEYFVIDLLQHHGMAGASLAELERGLVATLTDRRWDRGLLHTMAEKYGTKAIQTLVQGTLCATSEVL